MNHTEESIKKDIERIGRIAIIPTLLEVVAQTTGMGFAAVARVTRDRWVACGVQDGAFFGTLCAIDPKPAQLKNDRIIGMFTLFAQLISFHLAALMDAEIMDRKLNDTSRELSNFRDEIRQYQHLSNHNFQEPLRKIRLFADILLKANERGEEEKIKATAQKINHFARGLTEMIKDLTDFTKGLQPGRIANLQMNKDAVLQLIAGLEKMGDDASKQKLAAAKKLLAHIESDMAIYTAAAYGGLSDAEGRLNGNAFTINTAEPHYHVLTTLEYDRGGESQKLNVPKGDIFHQFRKGGAVIWSRRQSGCDRAFCLWLVAESRVLLPRDRPGRGSRYTYRRQRPFLHRSGRRRSTDIQGYCPPCIRRESGSAHNVWFRADTWCNIA